MGDDVVERKPVVHSLYGWLCRGSSDRLIVDEQDEMSGKRQEGGQTLRSMRVTEEEESNGATADACCAIIRQLT